LPSRTRALRWALPCALLLALLVTPGSAAAAQCGRISSPALNSLGYPSYHVFTYKYSRCNRARALLTAYLRKVGDLSPCVQDGCVRRVNNWKCRSPQVHGTMVSCVPKGAAWSSTHRPSIGISNF
jgi:hypothetical protein